MKLIYYRHNKNSKMAELPIRSMHYTELTFVLSGTLDYVIENQRVVLTNNEVLFADRRPMHTRKAIDKADYISFNFIWEDGDTKYDLPLLITNAITSEIKLLLSACEEIFFKTEDNAEQICLLIKCLLKQLSVNSSKQKRSPLTLQIMHYVNSHIEEAITLEQIAEITHFSTAYCSAVFKKDIGKAIIDYVLDRKIDIAKNMIFNGESLKYISDKLGFADYNYFSRVFKKRTTCSPLQYKKQIKSSQISNDVAFSFEQQPKQS